MKIYKTLFLGLGLIALSSCSDFLNQTSPSELDNESTFNNAYYTELALNKVYGSLTQDQTYSNFLPIIAGTNTDCELIDGLGTDASNTSSERGNMNYNGMVTTFQSMGCHVRSNRECESGSRWYKQ